MATKKGKGSSILFPPNTFKGMNARDHFGVSMGLDAHLEKLGLRMVWSPKGWAVYEAGTRNYDAVVTGTSMEELDMFVRGAVYGRGETEE